MFITLDHECLGAYLMMTFYVAIRLNTSCLTSSFREIRNRANRFRGLDPDPRRELACACQTCSAFTLSRVIQVRRQALTIRGQSPPRAPSKGLPVVSSQTLAVRFSNRLPTILVRFSATPSTTRLQRGFVIVAIGFRTHSTERAPDARTAVVSSLVPSKGEGAIHS
jgi:hypothetical protein